jgi:anti-sigma regulatory factor (Ser/Thr protein kinase)
MSEIVDKLQNLTKDIEYTKNKVISLKASAEKEEEILRSIVKEIKDLGFDPKTLKDDIARMEKEIADKISSKEKELEDIKVVLSEIENNVRSHEIC